MPRRILDTSKINKTRLELINKGYLTRSEIAKFVPCGRHHHRKQGRGALR